MVFHTRFVIDAIFSIVSIVLQLRINWMYSFVNVKINDGRQTKTNGNSSSKGTFNFSSIFKPLLSTCQGNNIWSLTSVSSSVCPSICNYELVRTLLRYWCNRFFNIWFVCLFVCLGLSSHSRIFHWYGDVTITDKGLQRGRTTNGVMGPVAEQFIKYGILQFLFYE